MLDESSRLEKGAGRPPHHLTINRVNMEIIEQLANPDINRFVNYWKQFCYL
jgi:hypothetical protein